MRMSLTASTGNVAAESTKFTPAVPSGTSSGTNRAASGSRPLSGWLGRWSGRRNRTRTSLQFNARPPTGLASRRTVAGRTSWRGVHYARRWPLARSVGPHPTRGLFRRRRRAVAHSAWERPSRVRFSLRTEAHWVIGHGDAIGPRRLERQVCSVGTPISGVWPGPVVLRHEHPEGCSRLRGYPRGTRR
jgi:hypothetical protein